MYIILCLLGRSPATVTRESYPGGVAGGVGARNDNIYDHRRRAWCHAGWHLNLTYPPLRRRRRIPQRDCDSGDINGHVGWSFGCERSVILFCNVKWLSGIIFDTSTVIFHGLLSLSPSLFLSSREFETSTASVTKCNARCVSDGGLTCFNIARCS